MTELTSSMRDSKWCRLLEAISGLSLPSSYWRLLGREREYHFGTPTPDMIVEHDGRRGIGYYGATGPFFFRDVETVRWPAVFEHTWARGYSPNIIVQPLGELAEALVRAGRFDYTLDDAGLTLFAYRRRG